MFISSYNMGIAFSSYYFYIEKSILKIKKYRGNDYLFTLWVYTIKILLNGIKMCYTIFREYLEIYACNK